jgi:hypothetical protein
MAANAGVSLHALQAASGLNLQRQRNFITGIQGVAPGGQASVNMACDRRYHRLIFQVVAVNYTGGTGLTATALSGVGTGLNVTATVGANHTVTTIIPTAGSTGAAFVTGDTVTFTDATGAGFVGTVTASAGAVTAIAITSTGTPTAISASTAILTAKLLVNGVNVCDLTAAQEILRAQFNSMPGLALGQFPILFTEPWRNLTRWPEITSWDMAGQTSFQIQLQFSPNLVNPGLTGQMEFDYQRNTSKGAIVSNLYQSLLASKTAPNPILSPISRHAFTFQLNAGLNLIGQGQIPFNYPILRLYFIGSIPGNITQLEIDQDSSKVEEGYIITQNAGAQLGQTTEMLAEYGFNTSIFDAAYVPDINQRIENALKCQSNLQLKIYSAVAQSLTILEEKLPGSYSS